MIYSHEWAAGIMEGEGCFSMHKRKNKNYYEFAIHCEMTDKDVVETLHKVLNEGKISQRKRRGNRSPTWVLSIQNKAGVKRTIEILKPYMHKRRKDKLNKMLLELE